MPSLTSVENLKIVEKIADDMNSELNDVNIEPVLNIDKKLKDDNQDKPSDG